MTPRIVRRNPNIGWVRTRIPRQAQDNAHAVARLLGVTVWMLYTMILSRELYNCDPVAYAAELRSQVFGLTAGGEDE